MNNELNVKGFSAVSEKEMFNVDGGSLGASIVIAIVLFFVCAQPAY